jgi:hypothetical protein
MAKNNRGNRGERSAFSFDSARDNPLATAAAVGGAVAAGVFLWSRRNQITDQINSLGEQIGEWREGIGSPEGEFELAGTESEFAASATPSTRGLKGRNRGMSETGGGNASLGRRSGGGGKRTTASSRGRARGIPSTT